MSGPNDDWSLKDARDWLRKKASKGARCPCCRQYVKRYRRPLGATMARVLIAFYKKPGWNRVKDLLGKNDYGGDYAKLVYWNLLEGRPGCEGM